MDSSLEGAPRAHAADPGIGRRAVGAGDDLHGGIVAVLLADPRMESLLAEALELVDGDPDAAATLVRLRLHEERPGDEGARTVLGHAVALAARARVDGRTAAAPGDERGGARA